MADGSMSLVRLINQVQNLYMDCGSKCYNDGATTGTGLGPITFNDVVPMMHVQHFQF